MPEVEVKDIKNAAVGKMGLPDEVFGVRGKEYLLHEAVVNFLANQRQGTHATKTKGLVSGGGKKPWKQKHTGRARSGSIRSPLWRGGGAIFGPQPRDYRYGIPKQARRQALYAAVSEKLAAGEMFVVEELKFDEPRTKKMIDIIEAMGLGGKSLLIVEAGVNRGLLLSSRNIPGVICRAAADLNAHDVLSRNVLLMTRAAAEALKERAG